ncbi:hypothetical protein HMPREF9718_04962 [Sphingobium yanoikuyae ATCC 51230]|uniref:Uncharacterized protein n=1 Tax=Sphingobium yanoikuyae ATCC 51230 TaxID=883163 RepID=K9CNL3_SPHYA|nr:hypothetical protein HMPREF9718_04962 [Sphingobium yanoikuyae ATCC 51230]
MVRRVGCCDHERLSPTFLREPRSSGIRNPYLDRPQTGRTQGVTTLLDSLCDW